MLFAIWQVFWLTPLFNAFPSVDSGVKIKQHKGAYSYGDSVRF
jgi:hypothetical protein